jgi:hypothetical protein
MNENKRIENMERIFHMLGDVKITKKQHSQIADMFRIAFFNGFHTALHDHAGVYNEPERMQIASQNETCQHIMFLAQYNSH